MCAMQITQEKSWQKELKVAFRTLAYIAILNKKQWTYR